MPGPMGGGRGGGFSGGSRGGSFGGGSHGGGFHGGSRGPMHHGPHHHHHGPIFMGPMFGRRRYYGGGGGCLGSIVGAIMIPIVFFMIFAIIILALIFGESGVGYDDQAFQEYANEQYYAAFSDTDDYEGNILIVFLTYEGYDGYDCIPWGGYNIDAETEELFGSYFESAVRNATPDYYEFALTKSFRQIINTMTGAAPGKATAETVDTQHSIIYNNTGIEIDKGIVNTALQEFTEKTGYPIAIVVEDGAEVFGKESAGDGADLDTAFVVIFITVVAVLIFAFIKTKKNNGGGGGASSTTDKTNPDSGQGKYDPNTGEWK